MCSKNLGDKNNSGFPSNRSYVKNRRQVKQDILRERGVHKRSDKLPSDNELSTEYEKLYLNKLKSVNWLELSVDALKENKVGVFIDSIQFTGEVRELLMKVLFTDEVTQTLEEREHAVAMLECALRNDIIYWLVYKMAEKSFYVEKLVPSDKCYQKMIDKKAVIAKRHSELNNDIVKQAVDECIEILTFPHSFKYSLSHFRMVLENFCYATEAPKEIWPVCFYIIYNHLLRNANSAYAQNLVINHKITFNMLPRIYEDEYETLGYNNFTQYLKKQSCLKEYNSINAYIFNQLTHFYDMLYFYECRQSLLNSEKEKIEDSNVKYEKEQMTNSEILDHLKQTVLPEISLVPVFLKYELVSNILPENNSLASLFFDEFIEAVNTYVELLSQALYMEIEENTMNQIEVSGKYWLHSLMKYTTTTEFILGEVSEYHVKYADMNRIFHNFYNKK